MYLCTGFERQDNGRPGRLSLPSQSRSSEKEGLKSHACNQPNLNYDKERDSQTGHLRAYRRPHGTGGRTGTHLLQRDADRDDTERDMATGRHLRRHPDQDRGEL